MLARSVDRGATWREVEVDGAVVPTQRILVFLPPAPSLAVDPTRGRVYVAFHDGRHGDADVLLWRSTDRGATFSAPVRVNDTPPGDGASQYLPRLALAPGGRLDVAYYDRRRDHADVRNEVSLQSSSDGGRSFGASTRLSTTAFDSRVGFGGEGGADLGTRLGLLSGDGEVLALWADTRRGTVRDVRQDIALAAVRVVAPSPWRGRGRLLAVAAAGAGVLLAGAALRRPRI